MICQCYTVYRTKKQNEILRCGKMSELLEAAMLLCFGCSWPLSVYKNFKAKTAKNMSLWFILLIIFGYVAGITAKIITGRINYVLAVYILNLVVVSMNLAVYFINKNYDRKSEHGSVVRAVKCHSVN